MSEKAHPAVPLLLVQFAPSPTFDDLLTPLPMASI